MNRYLSKESGKMQVLHIALLVVFLGVVLATFFIIYMNDRTPKTVRLDLKSAAQNTTGDISDAGMIQTDLLRPDETPLSNTKPVAQFTMSTPVKIGEKVVFKDESYDKDLGDSIVNRHWEGKKEFYTKAGTYTVTLKVQDDHGAWSEPVSHVIHVLDKPLEKYNLPPVALFKATNPVYVGETVIYQDASYDPDGGVIVDRKWEGKQTSFAAAGNYRVTLRVKDDKGKWSDPLYQLIQVKERPVEEVQRAPIALFEATTPVYVGQKVTYTDKSFDQDTGDSIVKRQWSSNARTKYEKEGKYDVTLKVQDNHGRWSETFTRTIEVIKTPNVPPVANFETNSPVYVNQKVTWKNTSYDTDGTIARVEWSGNKQYMYTKAGKYKVSLTAWDNRGAKNTRTKEIVVLAPHNQKPIAKFHTNDPVRTGERVYYWNDSYDPDGRIVKTSWSGQKKDVYDKAGSYKVTVTVKDNWGATSSYTKVVKVLSKTNVPPVAKISGPKTIYTNQTVTFKDESYDADGYITSTSWGKKALSKTWKKPGTYTVDLTVTDNNGASTTVKVPVYVREEGYPPSGS